MKVIKRNGSTEPYMVEKTKKVIAWMCEDLDVNPLWLEAVYNDALKDQMTTDEMHNTLIYKTITLASAKHPEWVFAAGRGRTMTLWKKTQAYEKTFSTFVRDMVKNGHYHKPFFDMYTDEELDSLDRVIDQRRDLDHSYSSVVTFENKSLLEGECIQQLFMANALVIATVEPKESRLDFAIEVYKALSMRKISLATPWLLNLRRGRNISSCFVISINDDLESIYNNLKRAAFISKNGGGVGIDFSNIRAKGASVAGSPNASGGVVGWIKLYNDTAIAVNQEGKRAGAFTCNLAIWHRDIEDFLEIQTEVGDMRKKSFDIKPQITNYDLFMETVDKNGTWYTFCPFEVKQTLNLSIVGVFGQDFNRVYESCVTAYKNGVLKNVGEYPAKELLKKWMKVQFETGMPYMTFVDRLNEFNPNKHDGFIPCLNLCTESSSNVVPDLYGHTCNLASIVMGRMNDYDDIEYHASLLCHVLDNGIDLTKTPTEISKAHNERYRTIGIGIQGLHDWLVKNDTNYHNIQECVRVAEVIEYGALKESIKLAKVRGAYPAYKGSMWDDGSLTARFARHSVAGKNWEEMQIGLNKYGCRNSQMTSPPPNTSTSIAMDATAGVMPVYSPFFVEDNKNGSLPVAAMFLKEKPLGYAKTMAMYDQKLLSAVVGGMQVFIDTGISAEYILDQNKEGFSAKDLYDLIFAAWRNNTKAIYYVRTVKRGTKLDDLLGIKSSTDCVACAG